MDSKHPMLTGSPTLIAKRKLSETWSQAVESRGVELGRGYAVLGAFHRHLEYGASEHESAYKALREHNSLWLVNEPLRRGDGGEDPEPNEGV